MPKRRARREGGAARGAAQEEGDEAADGAKRVRPDGAAGATRPESVTYKVERGLRHIEPYDFDFTTHVKQRWVGRPILEVFAGEFVAYPEEYYRASIEAGRVTVDGRKVSSGHVLQENERIVHRAVRCRENPVLDRGPIRVVAETEELLVVSKPSSLPIHPCGSYRFNSLIALLKEQGTAPAGAQVHTTHRLDRLTSGLVLLGKTKAAAQRIGRWFAQNEIRKTYLARVRGSFDTLVKLVVASSAGGAREGVPVGAGLAASGRVCVKGYIRCVDHKVGRHAFLEEPDADGDAKFAATEFEFVGAAPGGESVVRCYPLSGRTHQIRVHLLHLGYPIANDSCYGGELRDDPALPLIPHVTQHAGGVELQEPAPAEGEGATMHPSGIYLHASVYSLPNGDSFTAEAPPWAEGH